MPNFIILLLVVLFPSLSFAASFDCARAATKMEKLICGDPQLSRSDEDLAATYSKALKEASDPEAIKKQQREWLGNVRNRCDEVACLRGAYSSRITQLASVRNVATQNHAPANNPSLVPLITPHKLGVCRVINDPIDIYPTGDADTYLSHHMKQSYQFSYKPDGSMRTDTIIRIIEQPKHGKLVQEYPNATDYTRYHYKYIPDVDYGDFDYFVMEAKVDGMTVRIYYTMSVSLPGEPTYVLDENGQKTDDLSRCPKPDWKISSLTPAISSPVGWAERFL